MYSGTRNWFYCGAGCHDERNGIDNFVPEAGARYFGLSRNASYAAAARGDIPTLSIGRLKRVPVRAMERKLDEATRLGARA
jgi:hypothetical protein